MTEILTQINSVISQHRAVLRSGNVVRVPTTTVLPGGSIVDILVEESGGGLFRVSDASSALDAISDAGVMVLSSGDVRRANELAEKAGATFDGKSFYIDEVDASQLISAIVYTAEVARAWAQSTLESAMQARRVDASVRVEEKLGLIFTPAKVTKNFEVLGASSKKHTFDCAVRIQRDTFALFQVTSPAPNSIASTHLKFFDVAQSHGDWPREAIVERLEDWASEDIALLSQAASHIRGLERDWSDLEKLSRSSARA